MTTTVTTDTEREQYLAELRLSEFAGKILSGVCEGLRLSNVTPLAIVLGLSDALCNTATVLILDAARKDDTQGATVALNVILSKLDDVKRACEHCSQLSGRYTDRREN